MGSANEGLPPLGKVSKDEGVATWAFPGLFESPVVRLPGVLVDPVLRSGDVTDPSADIGELLAPVKRGDFKIESLGRLENPRFASRSSFNAAGAVTASSRVAMPIFFNNAAAPSSSQPFATDSCMKALLSNPV